MQKLHQRQMGLAVFDPARGQKPRFILFRPPQFQPGVAP